jgi:hypothetical protein
MRRFRKIFERLDARNAEMMKASEELHPYISICANIQTLDEGNRPPLDAPEARGYSMIWRLE